MSSPLWFSRLTLRRDAPIDAVAEAALRAGQSGDAISVQHRLIWGSLSDSPERERDFLWREAGGGQFYVLSRRPPPREDDDVFDIAATPFEPCLTAGDRLSFALRVNATRSDPEIKAKNGKRGKRVDVAYNAMLSTPPEARADARHGIAQSKAVEWLAAKGESHGFALQAARLDGYRIAHLPRRRGASATIGVFDLEGLLSVEDPERFCAGLIDGYGRAKAFGCGLMLIKRAA